VTRFHGEVEGSGGFFLGLLEMVVKNIGYFSPG